MLENSALDKLSTKCGKLRLSNSDKGINFVLTKEHTFRIALQSISLTNTGEAKKSSLVTHLSQNYTDLSTYRYYGVRLPFPFLFPASNLCGEQIKAQTISLGKRNIPYRRESIIHHVTL